MTQHILITGANRGIGLALTQQLHQQGHHILAACRQASEALKSLSGDRLQLIENVDVSSEAGIQPLQKFLDTHNTSLDLLINNAGVYKKTPLESLDFAAIEAQIQVNAYGPLRVSEVCLPYLKAGGKLIIITSRMGSIADNTSGGMYGYRMSKSAVNSAGKSLALDLKPKNIAVGLIHPGYVKTDMTDQNGHVTPEDSARHILERIEDLNLETTGSFWHMNGEVLPW